MVVNFGVRVLVDVFRGMSGKFRLWYFSGGWTII